LKTSQITQFDNLIILRNHVDIYTKSVVRKGKALSGVLGLLHLRTAWSCATGWCFIDLYTK
ncbi:MAG: hypothetical protein JAY69_10345, partial [Candidatus Thiodiazotropha taylori]|nr:hypothetical protein [Candidatus Thiodiazotropha taylori]MCW4233013.1 hypothetical protein [Candidatus Thiodiazotropha taylori]